MALPGEEEPWEDADPFSDFPPATDPANVSAQSFGPDLSSQAPGQSTEPQPATDDGEGSGSEDPEPLPEFDPRVRQDFEGLLFLGKLTDQFTWVGHRFAIRTLTVGEVLEIGLIHREYVGTMSDVKAYQAAVVAACCTAVDNRPLPIPITDEPNDSLLRNRFDYILAHWFPPVLDVIYERYLGLEDRVAKVIAAMGKAPGWTESTPTFVPASV